MPNWPDVPDWKFGETLTVDAPSDPADHRSTKVVFLCWVYRVDHNPTESVFKGLVVRPSETRRKEYAGEIIEAYCGWWTPE